MGLPLPPGPRAPRVIQSVGWWKRPLSYLERCRARYGRRFTIRLVGTPPFSRLCADAHRGTTQFARPAAISAQAWHTGHGGFHG